MTTVDLGSLELQLGFTNRIFILTVKNPEAETMRIWGQTFLYGYYMYSFRLRKESESSPALTIERTKIRWTVNVPACFPLEPGGEQRVEVDLNDGTWDLAALDQTENDSPIYVSVEMRIDENELTKEYEITTGRAVSNELVFPSHSAFLGSTK